MFVSPASSPSNAQPSANGPDLRAALWQQRISFESRCRFAEGNEEDVFGFSSRLQLSLVKAGLHLSGTWQRGRENARRIRLRRETRWLPGLSPDYAGLTLLHLSDLHASIAYPDLTAAAIEALDGVSADLALFTGDYRFGHWGPRAHVAPAVAELLARLTLRYGAWGVLGNHDLSHMREELAVAGLRILVNEGVCLETERGDLWIGGVDDPNIYKTASVPCALEGAPPDTPRLLLAHSPEAADEAAASGVSVYFCGHTHAGQLCLPYWGAVKSNMRGPRSRLRGWWAIDAMAGHTSPGLGTTELPVRYHCPPEATLITIGG